MALWNYRGVLEDEWRERKEKVGLTTDDALKLGIETAEKAQIAAAELINAEDHPVAE